MPSTLHEALVQMFRHRPSLAAELLTSALGVDLPNYQQATLASGDLTDLVPTEYRADAVVVLTSADQPVLAVVVEAQLGRDRAKRWTWPVYLTTLRARLRCPAVLLVICVDAPTAGWCAGPIELGHPGWVLVPLVLGPDQVPVVTDVDQASRAPELAMLSAVTHARHPDGDKVLSALAGALSAVGQPWVTLYSDVVFAVLPAAARRYLEAIMTAGTFAYEYKSDFVRKYVFEGRAEGLAEAVLTNLDARGIDVPDEARARITGCTDLDQLKLWVRQAATATSIDDVFDE
jgi:hypothetical protein